LGLVLGCGSEDDGGLIAPVENPEQTLAANLGQMGVITDGADVEPGNQLLDDPALQQLLSAVGFDDSAPLVSIVREGVSGSDRPTLRGLRANKLTPPRPRIDMLEGTGTYVRDVNVVTGPFPGWLHTSELPTDGYVFQFQIDDGFSYWDEEAMAQVPVHGEFRLLEVVIANPGTEEEYLQHLVIEIAASPDPNVAPPTLARLELQVSFTSEELLWTIGNERASAPNGSASFIGPLLYFVELRATQTVLGIDPPQATVDFDVTEQLYNSLESFAVRFESSVTVRLPGETTASARWFLAAGETSTPQSPPLRFEMNFTNFRVEGMVEVADVAGHIRLVQAPLAELLGDTSEVPVDLDGDGEPDGTCVNINIAFADNPTVWYNVCEVESLEGSGLPF
jgi:hypothetical protein